MTSRSAGPGPESPRYAAARLHRALAEDPRTAEPGVQITVRGDAVFLAGQVASRQRRDAVGEIAAEHVPDMNVRNEVQVMPAGEPDESEELP